MPVQQTTERWIVNPDGSKTRGVVISDVAETEPSYSTPRTHAEADEQAAALGLSFPDDVSTVKEKQEFLAENVTAEN